nr:MAG TPA: hypothetical protein [Bacteriophage sp.]
MHNTMMQLYHIACNTYTTDTSRTQVMLLI